jgi:putative ABC transport system permease protein
VTRQFHNWIVVGRLKRGISISAAHEQVDVISSRLQQLYPDTNKIKGLRLDPLQSALLQPQRPRVMLLTGAVVLLLSIACANVAGLLLARGAARRSEFAVRTALGASRARLAGQLVAESVALALISGTAGVVMAVWLRHLLPIATGLAARGVSASGFEWNVLGFAVAVTILTGVAAGVAPAIRAGGLRPAVHLAPGARSTDSREGTRLRALLVVFQVALSLLLLVGAGLLVRSFANLMRVDLGFDPRQVLTGHIHVPYADVDRRIQFFTGLRDDVAALPGVTSVSVTSHVPVRDPAGDPPVWAAERPPVDGSQMQSAALRLVLPGYFDTLRIPIVAGRDLSERDRRDTASVVVINQTMARRLFPGEEPLGRRVMMATGGTPAALDVVGVAADARIYGVGQRAPMTMYVTVRQMPPVGLNLVARTELDPELLAETVRKRVAARDRDVALESLRPLEDTIADSLTPERVTTVTLTLFSGIALLLAALGLYGVLAFHVTQRTHEIGVRMALGAQTRDVLAQVLGRSGIMVLPGLALGLACALAGSRAIERLLFEVPPADLPAIAVATVTLAIVALAASALPAWRAARVNPVQALRGE